jgi:hypothetical protein
MKAIAMPKIYHAKSLAFLHDIVDRSFVALLAGMGWQMRYFLYSQNPTLEVPTSTITRAFYSIFFFFL